MRPPNCTCKSSSPTCVYEDVVFKQLINLYRNDLEISIQTLVALCFKAMECGVNLKKMMIPIKHHEERDAETGSVTVWDDELPAYKILDHFCLGFVVQYPDQRVAMLLACHYHSNIPVEPLLQPNPSRFVLFPIKHQTVWNMHKAMEARFWPAEAYVISSDMAEWRALPTEHRDCLSFLIASFVLAGGLLNTATLQTFASEVEIAEVRSFYSAQQAMENIHNEVFGLVAQHFIPSIDWKQTLETRACFRAKQTWIEKYILDLNKPFAERLVAFAALEIIGFSGALVAIQEFSALPVFRSICRTVWEDKTMHGLFAAILYHQIREKPSAQHVRDIVHSLVRVEQGMYLDRPSVLGMSGETILQYVEFVADKLLTRLRLPVLYNVKQNPTKAPSTLETMMGVCNGMIHVQSVKLEMPSSQKPLSFATDDVDF